MLMYKEVKNFLEKLKFVRNYQRFLRATIKEKRKLGSCGKWAGALGVSDDREKSFGAPDVQITPLAALIWPSAQMIFLSKLLKVAGKKWYKIGLKWIESERD